MGSYVINTGHGGCFGKSAATLEKWRAALVKKKY